MMETITIHGGHDKNKRPIRRSHDVLGDLDDQIVDAIQAQARGCYQRALLAGVEAWSGASLRGKANTYGGRYAASRDSLLRRIKSAMPAGWYARCTLVLRDSRWCRELVIEDPQGKACIY